MSSRKLERRELSQTVTVADVINDSPMGELINITREGLMLITDRMIETQSIFQLALQLPQHLEGSDQLVLGADCLWCRQAENFHRYWAGFQIIDASDTALAQIDALISLYGKA